MVDHVAWTEPMLSIEVKVSCSRKQWEPLMGFEQLGISQLQVKLANRCAQTPLQLYYAFIGQLVGYD